MNHNDRALAGLAWLAATLPTLVQQDCLGGDEIVAITAYQDAGHLHFRDYATTARVAARLGLDLNEWYGADSEQTWWTGKSGDVMVRVMTCDPKPCVCDDAEHTCRARYGTPNASAECLDEVTA